VIFSFAPRAVLYDDGVGRFEMTVRGVVGGFFGAFDPVYVERSFLAAELGEPAAASVLFVYRDAPFEAQALASSPTGRPETSPPGLGRRINNQPSPKSALQG
jgi:hypothetical protein